MGSHAGNPLPELPTRFHTAQAIAFHEKNGLGACFGQQATRPAPICTYRDSLHDSSPIITPCFQALWTRAISKDPRELPKVTPSSCGELGGGTWTFGTEGRRSLLSAGRTSPQHLLLFGCLAAYRNYYCRCACYCRGLALLDC